MLTNDLNSTVTIDPFGARVPGGDEPLSIHHADRVIDHRIDQKLKSFSLSQFAYSAHSEGGASAIFDPAVPARS